MDFTLTDEQSMLRDTARALFAKEAPTTLARACIADAHGADGLWAGQLSGWMELAGTDLVDLTLFMEEYGRALVPGAFLPTLLAAQFAPVADGVTSTLAMAGADGYWVPRDGATRTFVPEAELVDTITVVSSGSVVTVPAAEVTMHAVETMEMTRHFATIEVPTGLAWSPLTVDQMTAATERCTVIVAAELIGVARWLLDTSVEYSKERIQFDKPIGSFQGLQWKMADAALALERAAAAVSYAAMCVDADDADRHRAVHGARAEAGTAGKRVATDAMAVHGGIGYTYEHDLHLYLRRAFAAEGLFGTVSWHIDRLADLLFA
jgi:alkylation response protein AidB-like acyl-CoA dehydrogenase